MAAAVSSHPITPTFNANTGATISTLDAAAPQPTDTNAATLTRDAQVLGPVESASSAQQREMAGPSTGRTDNLQGSITSPSPSLGTHRPRLQPLKTTVAQPSVQDEPFTGSITCASASPRHRTSAIYFLQAAAAGGSQSFPSVATPHNHAAGATIRSPVTASDHSAASVTNSLPSPRSMRIHDNSLLRRTATVSSPANTCFSVKASPLEGQPNRIRTRSSATEASPSLRRHYTNATPRYTTFEAAAAASGGSTRAVTASSPSLETPSPRAQRRQSFALASPSLSCPALRPRLTGTAVAQGLEAKVVILGAQGVGKTSIVHRYTSGHFSTTGVPSTIGASFLTKKLIVSGVKCRLQIWDTAGQERFRSMAPMYYRGSHAAIIVYDITSRDTFADVKTWIEELRRNMGDDLILQVVGAKRDLAPHSREVEGDYAREQVLRWLCPERETAMAAAAAAAAHASSAAMTPSTSRLGSLGSLAMGSASRRLGVAFTSKRPTGRSNDASAVAPESNNSASGSEEGLAGVSAIEEGLTLPGDDLDVQLTEVSAKHDEGIEDVFVAITERLVERRVELEQERLERQRNSIFLSETGAPGCDAAGASENRAWTCC